MKALGGTLLTKEESYDYSSQLNEYRGSLRRFVHADNVQQV